LNQFSEVTQLFPHFPLKSREKEVKSKEKVCDFIETKTKKSPTLPGLVSSGIMADKRHFHHIFQLYHGDQFV
jgi:hypothetical protein